VNQAAPTFPHEWDQARYSESYLRLGSLHDAVVARCLTWIRVHHHFALEVDVGAKLLRGRAAGALRRAGVAKPSAVLFGRTGAGMAGLVDLVGVAENGRAIFVEVKAPAWLVPSKKTGRLVQKRAADVPTTQQMAFLREVHRRGAYAGVAWHERDLDGIFGVTPKQAQPMAVATKGWEGLAG
jgi:hypothetical protein